jgi:hypothetical protein
MSDEQTDTERPPAPNGNGNGSGERWVSATQCDRLSGISRRELERLGNRGEIQRKRETPGGDWVYYLPDALAIGIARSKRGAFADAPEVALAKAQVDLLQKTQGHLERSWSLIHAPALDFMTELRTALKDANEEIRKLQGEIRAGERLRRELEDSAHVRKLATEEMDRDQRRKDEAFEGAKKAAKTVWPAIEEAIAGLSLGKRLRDTIDLTKIQALLDVPGMLDEREAALLRELFNLKKPAGETVDATAEPAEPGEGSEPDGG